MTWNYTHDAFGWTTSWDAMNGFGVQACEKAPGADDRQTAALNIANGGQLAVQDDWIYMNPANKYNGPNSLVKIKLDGSGKQTLAEDNALYIVDGTGHTALGNARATSLYFAGTDLYYPSAFHEDNELRKLEPGK